MIKKHFNNTAYSAKCFHKGFKYNFAQEINANIN